LNVLWRGRDERGRTLAQPPKELLAQGGEQAGKKPRVLIVSHSIPKPDAAAGDRRLFILIEMIARRCDVDFCSTWDEFMRGVLPDQGSARYRRMLEDLGVRVIEADWRSVPTALAHNRYDLAIIEFYHVAAKYMPIIRASQPGIKILIDSVDVHYAREMTAVTVGAGDASGAERIKAAELAAYRAADAVVAITDLDTALLQSEGGMPPMYLLPITLPVRSRPAMMRNRECLFIGGFGHAPNLDGLRWFCKEIWASVRAEVPDATLTVIGSHVPPEVEAFARLPGITVLGFVPDTVPYLERAALSVAPLRFGAGMKGKVIEAMAHALPVVTTAIGAQGLNVMSGRELSLADTPEAFAQAVIELLQNPQCAEQMGLAGQEYIAGLCSPPVVETSLNAMLSDFLTTAPKSPRPLAYLRWQAVSLGLRALSASLRGRRRRSNLSAR
jgi:hypothetical protein